MTSSMRRALFVGCLTLVVFIATPSAQAACKVNDLVFSSNYRWSDTEGNFNDYGRIHYDAHNSPECAKLAAAALAAKIQNTIDVNPDEFEGWLRGAYVALIYASAIRLGANGFATQALNEQLTRLENAFEFTIEDGCGNVNGNNTCMDDYAVAASGFAWMAAYKYRRGHSDASVASVRNKAVQHINNFYDSVCIHSPTANPTSICNGSLQDLEAGIDETLSFNHGHQKPPYGFGLMTSIASAVLGLKVSEFTYSLADRKVLSFGLMKEMQKHVDTAPTPDVFKSDCYRAIWNGAYWEYVADKHCGGSGTVYMPEMYDLYTFYQKKFGSIPNQGVPGVFQSSFFRSSLFDITSSSMSFFGPARHQTYGEHGTRWWQITPEWMPTDQANPKGFLEQVSATGLAQGWTCDPDAPLKSNVVDIYAGSTKVTNLVRADSQSEGPIKTECNGGDYHRFWIQLPSWTKGQTIIAYGQDYTWYGTTTLPCLQPGGCKW